MFPYKSYDVFELQNVDEVESKAEFGVEKGDLLQLAEVLGIPRVFWCDQESYVMEMRVNACFEKTRISLLP